MNIKNLNLNTNMLFAKSFYMLGDSLDFCFDCKYCRLNGEKNIEQHYHILPELINDNFSNIPIAINLFYGDPLLQIDNTIKYLKALEQVQHKGPVIIVTKGDYKKFPDTYFNLDLHFAFSTFGIDSYLDGNTMERFENNLKEINKRKNNYKYSIEFRPIIYNINDDNKTFNRVLNLAHQYDLSVGYSGLQGKKECVEIWKKENINLLPYPGYNFGHKKIIADNVIKNFENLAHEKDVPIFRKTSCLFSYTHNLDRDYNAHYYRPNEMNCYECVMKDKCFSYKDNLEIDKNLEDIIPFNYKIIEKSNHECILKKNGICEFPSDDCSKINGKILKIDDTLTTSDVRVIKWLTGYTVDAPFIENPHISNKWIKKKVR